MLMTPTLLPEIEKIAPVHPTTFKKDSILVLLMLTLDKFHIVPTSSFIILNMFFPRFRGNYMFKVNINTPEQRRWTLLQYFYNGLCTCICPLGWITHQSQMRKTQLKIVIKSVIYMFLCKKTWLVPWKERYSMIST